MGGCGGCAFKGHSTAVEDTFVGVRLREEVNLTLCASGGEIFSTGEAVVVDLEHGPAWGHIEKSPMPVFKPCQKSGARRILRRATDQDRRDRDRQLDLETTAKRFAQERVRALKLDMKVSRVDFAFAGREATLYFTAEARVDFRQLVRDVAQRFSAKVKMVQIGARDEAALVGGLGVCGRTLCCSSWLEEFRPISIAMAKRQNLSLNPSKISGQCGRLLCCLAYEDENYRKGGPREAPGTDAEAAAEALPERSAALPQHQPPPKANPPARPARAARPAAAAPAAIARPAVEPGAPRPEPARERDRGRGRRRREGRHPNGVAEFARRNPPPGDPAPS